MMDGDMLPDAAMLAAVERLYAVFAPYPAPVELHASPLRNAAAILQSLQSAPLRELLPEQLGYYAGTAVTTVGDRRTYYHFLPRIIELAVHSAAHTGFEPAVIASKLTMEGGPNEDERGAVRAAFLAIWCWSLTQDVMLDSARRWLVGLSTMGGITDALDIWRSSPSPHAVEHFAEFVSGYRIGLDDGDDGRPAFWPGGHSEPWQEMKAWMHSPETWHWLEQAALLDTGYTQQGIRRAIDILWPKPPA